MLTLQKFVNTDNKNDTKRQILNKLIVDLERLFNTKMDEIKKEMERKMTSIKYDVMDITRMKMETKENINQTQQTQ